MEINFKDHLILSILIALMFVLSLTYYLGYFWGIGISPQKLPLTVNDIINGMIINLPITLAAILVGIILKITLQYKEGTEKIAEEKLSYSFCDKVKSSISFLILIVTISVLAFKEFNFLLFISMILIFMYFINSINIIPFFIRFLFQTILIMFSIGFLNGKLNLIKVIQPEKIILTNNKIYSSRILAFLELGTLIKDKGNLLLINNKLIRQIKYSNN